MSVDYWHDMSIVHGAIQLAGNAKSDVVNVQSEAKDSTGMSTAGFRSFVGGLMSGDMSMDFMQDFDGSTAIDSTLWSYFGVAGVPKSICRPSTSGALAYMSRTLTLGYTPIDGAVGDIAMGKVSGVSSTGPIIRGKVLLPSGTAVTSSSTGSGVQLGAVAAGKSLYAALHVLSVAGTSTPTITVKVQSDDNSGFTSATDRITFTGATAIGYQWSSVAGAITDDYWRVSYTISGSSTSFSVLVTAGII